MGSTKEERRTTRRSRFELPALAYSGKYFMISHKKQLRYNTNNFHNFIKSYIKLFIISNLEKTFTPDDINNIK